MSTSYTPVPTWPDVSSALDAALDKAGVFEQTGCTEEDFADLGAVFEAESANALTRLAEAKAAIQAQGAVDLDTLATTAHNLRTAAHELVTSFGVIGARGAAAYARATEQRIKHRQPGTTAAQLVQAADALAAAVKHVNGLLRAG